MVYSKQTKKVLKINIMELTHEIEKVYILQPTVAKYES